MVGAVKFSGLLESPLAWWWGLRSAFRPPLPLSPPPFPDRGLRLSFGTKLFMLAQECQRKRPRHRTRVSLMCPVGWRIAPVRLGRHR
jgi:hypothetical protein